MLKGNKKLRLTFVILFAIVLFVATMVGALADKGGVPHDPDGATDIYSELDYSIPQVEDYYINGSLNYIEKVCYNNGYTDYCVYLVEQDEDYPCEFDGVKRSCGAMTATSRASYTARLHASSSSVFGDYGVPIIDYRFGGNETENQSYPTHFLDDTRLQTAYQDFYTEGFVKIGFNSNVFYYSNTDYGSGINISVDGTVEMSNNEYDCQSDADILSCLHFKYNTEESSISPHDVFVINATHKHEHYEFSGNNASAEYLTTVESNDFDFFGTNKTITFSFKKVGASVGDSAGINGTLFIKKDTGTPFYAYYMSIRGNKKIRLAIHNSSGVYQSNGLDSDVLIEDNNWYHISLVENYTEFYMYVNGELQSDSISMSGLPLNSNSGFRIGGSQAGRYGNIFNGSIDEFIVWNRSLTSTEIQELYDRGLYTDGLNNDSYYESAVVDSGETVNITAFVASIFEPNLGNISFKFRTGDVARVDSTDTDLLLYVSFNNYSYAEIPEPNNLIWATHFKDDAVDEISGNVPTMNTATKQSEGYDFDGVDDTITYDNTNLNFTDFTMSFWFFRDTGYIPTFDWPLDIENGGSDLMRFALDGNNFIARMDTPALANQALPVISKVYQNNLWHHVVVTYNNSDKQMYMYFDKDISVQNLTIVGSYSTDQPNVYIGGTYIASGRFIDGEVDEIMIWNKALNSSQAEQLYNDQRMKYLDEANNLNISTLSNPSEGYFYNEGGATFGQNASGVSDNHEVIAFDSTNVGDNEAFYRTQFNFTTQNFTIRAIIKPVSAILNFGRLNDDMSIFSYGRDVTGSPSEGGYIFRLANYNSTYDKWQLSFRYRNDSLSNVEILCSIDELDPIEPDVWSSVAVTGGYVSVEKKYNVSLYVNGQFCDSALLLGEMMDVNGTATRVQPCIGALGYECNATAKYQEFVGDIDEVAIYNRVLTESELTEWNAYTAELNSGETNVPGDNGRYIQYQAIFRNTNKTLTPYLTYLNYTTAFPTKLLTSLSGIEVELNSTQAYNLTDRFNVSEGGTVCSGVTGSDFSASVTTGCHVRFVATGNAVVTKNAQFVANNGFGELKTGENIDITRIFTNYTDSVSPASRTTSDPFIVSVNLTSIHNITEVKFGIQSPGGAITNLTGTLSGSNYEASVNETTIGTYFMEYLYVDTNVSNYTFRPQTSFFRTTSSGAASSGGSGAATSTSTATTSSVGALSLLGDVSDNVTIEQLEDGIERSYNMFYFKYWTGLLARSITVNDDLPSSCEIDGLICSTEGHKVSFSGDIETGNQIYVVEEMNLTINFNETTYNVPVVIKKINFGIAVNTDKIPYEVSQDGALAYLLLINSDDEVVGIKVLIPIFLVLGLIAIPIVRMSRTNAKVKRKKKLKKKVKELRQL